MMSETTVQIDWSVIASNAPLGVLGVCVVALAVLVTIKANSTLGRVAERLVEGFVAIKTGVPLPPVEPPAASEPPSPEVPEVLSEQPPSQPTEPLPDSVVSEPVPELEPVPETEPEGIHEVAEAPAEAPAEDEFPPHRLAEMFDEFPPPIRKRKEP